MDCHVLSHWHVHQDQPLCERENRKSRQKNKYIERHLGLKVEKKKKGRKVQRSSAQTKKKGKDSPSPPQAGSHYFSLKAHLLLFHLGNDAKFQGKGFP